MTESEITNLSKPSKKHLFAAVMTILLVWFCGWISLQWLEQAFSKSFHPLYSSSQSFYTWVGLGQLDEQDQEILLEVFRPFLSEPLQEEVKVIIENSRQLNLAEITLFAENQELYTAWKQASCQEGEDMQAFLEQTGLQLTSIQLDNDCYQVIGQQQWQYQGEDVQNQTIKQKKQLWDEFHEEYPQFFLLQPNVHEQALAVVGIAGRDEVLVESGLLGQDFFTERETKELENVEFLVFRQEAPSLFSNQFAQQFPLLRFSGKYGVINGTLEEMLANPYEDSLQWFWEGNEGQADQLEEQLLTDLADQYPQVMEQVLPDESIVYELQENKEAFRSETADQTMLTYPQGQLIRSKNETVTRWETANNEPPENNRIHPCIYPQSYGYGYANAEFLGTFLWKRVFFSYDQQKMIFCFEKNT